MNIDLDIQAKKLELIQWLSTLEDNAILEKIMALRKQDNKDWWDSISEAEQKAIEEGIKDADAGKLNPHLKAKGLYEKWL